MFRLRHTLVASLSAALLAIPSLASAQRSVSFGVSGGLSAPIGSLGDYANSGYNITGHVFFAPTSTKTLGLRGDVSYDSWDSKGGGLTLRSLGFTGNGIYHFSDTKGSIFSPYALAGAGAFNLTTRVSGTNTSASSTDFGAQVGVGVEFQLASFSTFGEVKLVNVFGSGSSSRWFPVTFGVRF
jgi:opacity protein-like surface antigen